MFDQEPLGKNDRRLGSVFEKWIRLVDDTVELDRFRLRNALLIIQSYGKSRDEQKSGCGQGCDRTRLLLGDFSGCR